VAVLAPKVSDLGFSGATLEIPLSVTNRNGFRLPVGGVNGHVSIAGVQVGEISTSAFGALDANATKQVTLPLKVHFTSAALGLMEALRGGKANVQLTGSLESGGAEVPISFSQLLSIHD
jgi:LEA14-like dessication related protein